MARPIFLGDQTRDDLRLRFGRRKAVELARANSDAVAGKWRVQTLVQRAVGTHHFQDGQTERLSELEVALVVAGHGHDCAGAIRTEYVVRRVDRNLLARQRVLRERAGENARFLLVQRRTLHVALPRGGCGVDLDFSTMLGRGDLQREAMVGCDDHVRRAEQRVWTRRVYGDGVGAADEREVHFRTLAPPDPIDLFLLRLGPI